MAAVLVLHLLLMVSCSGGFARLLPMESWEGSQQCSPLVPLRRVQFFCGGELGFTSAMVCFILP